MTAVEACLGPQCPRCEGPMLEPIERNAQSRYDNRTLICHNCALDEAVLANQGLPITPPNQPVAVGEH